MLLWCSLSKTKACFASRSPFFVVEHCIILSQTWHTHTHTDMLDHWSASVSNYTLKFTWYRTHLQDSGPVWARELCRTSPPCFLAECRKKRLNQASFVLLYFVLFAFSGLSLVFVVSVLDLSSVMYFLVYTGVNCIPSTSFCSLSSWFTSSCTHHLITVLDFTVTTYHLLGFSLET